MNTKPQPTGEPKSDTPRTDAAEVLRYIGGTCSILMVDPDFARTLERELNEAESLLKHIARTYCGIEIGKPLEGIDEPETDISMVPGFVEGEIDRQSHRADKAEAERAQLRAALQECAEALDSLKPPTDCPFCDDINGPCGDCLSLARQSGQFAHILSNPIIQQVMKGT